MMKKILYIFCFSFLILLFPQFVNAKVEDYQFLGKSVDDVFSIPSGSSITGNTYIVVTGDSTGKYFVVDLCSTIGINFTPSVPSDFDGSYTSFYDMYDLNSSCSTGSYTGTKIRMFYLITTYADAGGGNLAINNTMKFVNNSTYTGVFKLISVGLVDTIDLGDLTINNQTTIINGINDINNSISNTEENIKNELNDVKDSINNTITDNFNSCRPSKNLWSNGVDLVANRNSYINLNEPLPAGTYTLSWESMITNSTNNPYLQFRTSDNSSIIGAYLPLGGNSVTFTLVEPAYIYRFFPSNNYANSDGVSTTLYKVMLVEGSTSLRYEEYGVEVCSNKIDETNDQLNNLNDNITNSNVSGVEESFSRFEEFLDDNSTITQLITLPVTLYSSILDGVSNSCTPFNLGNLYGETLILPCVNIGNYLGSTLWGMIDLIISGFAIYFISKKLIKVFNNFSSMKDGDVIDD